MLRLFLNGCLLLSVAAFPWWLTLGFMLLLLITARAYEVLLWGFVLDAVYGAPIRQFAGIPALFTLSAAAAFVVVEFVKPRLRFY